MYASVSGGDAAIGPNVNREDEFVSDNGVIKITFPIKELLDADQLIVGDLALGLHFSGENHGVIFLVAGGHGALKYSRAEDRVA